MVLSEMAKFVQKRVIAHHSLTRDSGTVSWGAIRKWHTEKLGYDAIGYHCGVELVKSGEELYYEILMGRMWDIAGAHTRGHNVNSLGICFIGNFDTEAPKEEMIQMGAEVIALWLNLFNLSIDAIYPHRHFASYKSCPGSKFDMDYLKMCVRECR